MQIFQKDDPVCAGGQGRDAAGLTSDAASVAAAVIAGLVVMIASFFD